MTPTDPDTDCGPAGFARGRLGSTMPPRRPGRQTCGQSGIGGRHSPLQHNRALWSSERKPEGDHPWTARTKTVGPPGHDPVADTTRPRPGPARRDPPMRGDRCAGAVAPRTVEEGNAAIRA